MPVDEKRAQAVFQMVIAAADPAKQAAILDRECAADPELRQRVEVLLRTHQESTRVLEEPVKVPTASVGSDGTLLFDPRVNRPAALDPDEANAGTDEIEEPVKLDFLQPSARADSLGRLGHYEILEVLGRGSFGIVVRAFDEKLQRVVAIKVLSPSLASTSPARKRFLREARASARIRHENVVQIYAVEEQPLPFLVMECIPGQTLQRHLDQTGPLDTADVLRIGEQIARGLAAAHEQGLVHRDIKPGNILLESGLEQKVKLTDFGLARAADDASLTKSGAITGTPLFMAPEQATGESLDHRADLFSLGSVLYTTVAGRPPFRASSALAVLKRVAEDKPRPIREIVPEAPQWLSAIIERLHAKDPAQRFQSAAEVADLLARHQAHLQQPSLVPLPPPVKAPQQRSPLRVALMAGAVVGLIALVAVLTYPLWKGDTSTANTPGPANPGDGKDPAPNPAAGPLRTLVVQGWPAARDAIIDFNEPDRSFGGADRDNALRRAEAQCNALLIRFDLAKLEVPPKARVEKATLSFTVWDPSSRGKAKVCAFPMKTAWDDETVSWRRPAAGKSWRAPEGFQFEADAGPAGASAIVAPDEANDTADPPIEYVLDITEVVRSWLEGGAPNHGLALAPVIDPSVDEGTLARFQVHGSKHGRSQYAPKLTVQVR